ncbi:MAG: hypothetical protein ACLFPL_03440 [Candidatus Nanoarchaeia archaeon]
MELLKYHSKKASQGIGTLIIFIALILVAAVAAGVIIQTANSLQSKALSVGSQTETRLVTFVSVNAVAAQDTSDGVINASVDEFIIPLRTGTDIEDIYLYDLTIQLYTQDGIQTLSYNETITDPLTQYSVEYTTNGGDPTLEGYLTGSDMMTINFVSAYNISNKDNVNIQFTPRDGYTLGVEFALPSTMTNTVTRLYP